MAGLWASLLPLAIASAIVPVRLVITVLLQRPAGGRLVSLARVLGMLTVRLGQGIVIGMLIGPESLGGDEGGRGTGASLLLLVVAVLLLVMAARKALDAPRRGRTAAALADKPGGRDADQGQPLGVGMLLIGAKFWVFTIGANSDDVLDRFSSAVTRYDRPITIGVGVIFGLWFLVRALDGLGVIRSDWPMAGCQRRRWARLGVDGRRAWRCTYTIESSVID